MSACGLIVSVSHSSTVRVFLPTLADVFLWNLASYRSPVASGRYFSPPPENVDVPTFAVSLPVVATVSATTWESLLSWNEPSSCTGRVEP